MLRRFACASIAALACALSSCAGPPIPAPIEDEPVCPDFQVGGTQMEGSLRYPVRLRVMNGKTVVMRIVLPGLRTPSSPKASTFISDSNDTYTLEWAQCDNERAPAPVETNEKEAKKHEKERREILHYECGDGTVYKTEELKLKKHDASSHVVHFAPPPNGACWSG